MSLNQFFNCVMITYFLGCIYLLLCFWAIPKIPFIRNTGLSTRETRLLLFFKLIVGIACAFYFQKNPINNDYLVFNNEGKIQYHLLLSNPTLFFTDISNDLHTYGTGGLFESSNSFWAYLKFNLLYKFIALVNLVTQGDFYFNTIIFSSIIFFGHIAFYRIYSGIYKGHKLTILFASFCLPSLLLYTACIHKDGIIFLCIGIISYIFYSVLSKHLTINLKYIWLLFISMSIIFLFRNYVMIAIVPALLTALLCKLLHYKKRFIFLVTYSIFILLFFLSGFSKSFINLPDAVIKRKADFALLKGAKTDIPMNELYPSVQSFISNLPQAINHYFFRPYLWEFSQPSILLTALELLMYQLIFLAFIFYRKKTITTIHPFNIFGLAFVFNMMLVIGYTIPNIGAIVRYRSIFWVFLICPLLCNTDWKRLISFRKNINSSRL